MDPIKDTENSHVVELYVNDKDDNEKVTPIILHPYVEVNLSGGVSGSGVVDKNGEVNIDDAHPTGTVTVDGIVQGAGSFNTEGDVTVTTSIADWQIQPAQGNKVLNFFRK